MNLKPCTISPVWRVSTDESRIFINKEIDLTTKTFCSWLEFLLFEGVFSGLLIENPGKFHLEGVFLQFFRSEWIVAAPWFWMEASKKFIKCSFHTSHANVVPLLNFCFMEITRKKIVWFVAIMGSGWRNHCFFRYFSVPNLTWVNLQKTHLLALVLLANQIAANHSANQKFHCRLGWRTVRAEFQNRSRAI